MPTELSLSQARRVALRAQGLDRPRPTGATVSARHVSGVVDRLGLLQIDSVNVLARAHLMPAFSRLGPYDPALLDRLAGRRPRRLTEAWAHEASFVPPSTWRLLGFDRRSWRDRMWGKPDGFVHTHAAELDEVRRIVSDQGPVTARQVHEHFAHTHPHAGGGWWDWSVAKEALERLFFIGELAVAGRTGAFERRYDLVERVIPAAVLDQPEPDEADAMRALVAIAARAHGVASARCLADYFRTTPARARLAAEELVEAGELEPVTVRGWGRPAWRWRGATVPRRATARALLSPFDPLIFERGRLLDLFGTHYRIEIYTPAAKRVHGYYVLPFLMGERIAARVDLTADRAAGVLLVQAAHHEQHEDRHAPPRGEVAEALVAELRLMGHWLGLAEVALGPGAFGDLTGEVAAALR